MTCLTCCCGTKCVVGTTAVVATNTVAATALTTSSISSSDLACRSVAVWLYSHLHRHCLLLVSSVLCPPCSSCPASFGCTMAKIAKIITKTQKTVRAARTVGKQRVKQVTKKILKRTKTQSNHIKKAVKAACTLKAVRPKRTTRTSKGAASGGKGAPPRSVSSVERKEATPKVVAYTRTSSTANMKGNSQARQLSAIVRQANQDGLNRTNIKKVTECVSGMVPLASRKKFMNLLNNTNTKNIYVESASRVARSAAVAEQIYQAAQATGTDIVVANNPNLFKRDANPEEHFFRRIHFAVAEYERDLVVHRLQMGLQAAMEKREKVHGRKTILESLAPTGWQKRALKKLIAQRCAGKFGFHPLAEKMSQVLGLRYTMAMETCRRLCKQMQ